MRSTRWGHQCIYLSLRLVIVLLKLNDKYTVRPSLYLPHLVFGYSSVTYHTYNKTIWVNCPKHFTQVLIQWTHCVKWRLKLVWYLYITQYIRDRLHLNMLLLCLNETFLFFFVLGYYVCFVLGYFVCFVLGYFVCFV